MNDLISRAEAAEVFDAMLKTATDPKIKIGISRSWQQIKDLPSADRPKGDLISRADAIRVVEKNSYRMAGLTELKLKCEIEVLPSADRPRGEWIVHDIVCREEICLPYECPNCGFRYSRRFNFCSNCGADMRGGEDK